MANLQIWWVSSLSTVLLTKTERKKIYKILITYSWEILLTEAITQSKQLSYSSPSNAYTPNKSISSEVTTKTVKSTSILDLEMNVLISWNKNLKINDLFLPELIDFLIGYL